MFDKYIYIENFKQLIIKEEVYFRPAEIKETNNSSLIETWQSIIVYVIHIARSRSSSFSQDQEVMLI